MPEKMLIEIENLKKYFPVRKGFFRRATSYVKAVDDVSLSINEGETLGLVGESGCGKTTIGRCILRAIEPDSAQILFHHKNGETVNIMQCKMEELRLVRKDLQLIFQDPFSSLNPRMTIKNIIGEPLLVHNIAKGKEQEEMVVTLLKTVGLLPEHMNRYPHAFSGGQRQRIGIARAIATNPRFIVCDEAVSALDVSIQAQILNLLQDIQAELSLTYLFISHDLGVVEHIANRVAVMYVGKIIELSESKELFRNPRHPYTEALLSAVPRPDPHFKSNRILLKGEVADPGNPPAGCYFHPRCRYAKDTCKTQFPPLENVANKGEREHLAACHFAEHLDLQGV
jgi:peptide/nickel transport system ATP-binding protein